MGGRGGTRGVLAALPLLVGLLSWLVHIAGAQTATIHLKRAAGDADVMAHVRSFRESQERAAANHKLRGSELSPEDDDAFVSLLQTSEDFGVGQNHALSRHFKVMEYHGDVTLGDSTFTMLFDTASPHIWVPAVSCATCCKASLGDKPLPLDQSQAVPLFEQFPEGTWFSGVSQVTAVTMGDLVVPDVTYAQIFVKGHRTVPVKLGADDEGCCDSVLGLGFSTRWSEPATLEAHHKLTHRELDALERAEGVRLSLVDKLFQEHLVTRPVFSLYLTDDAEGSVLELGRISTERIDPKRNPNGLFWVSAVGFPDFHWAFNVPRVCFDDQCVRVGNIAARVSSAVPYIAVPQELYELLRRPQERVSNPCQIMDRLPTIKFVAMGADDANINNRYSGSFELCPADYALMNDDSCEFAIVPTRLPLIVLGTPFLRKFFSAFDIENKRMGFAQVTEQCKEEEDGATLSLSQVMNIMKEVKEGASKEEVLAKLKAAAEGQSAAPEFLRDDTFLVHHHLFVN